MLWEKTVSENIRNCIGIACSSILFEKNLDGRHRSISTTGHMPDQSTLDGYLWSQHAQAAGIAPKRTEIRPANLVGNWCKSTSFFIYVLTVRFAELQLDVGLSLSTLLLVTSVRSNAVDVND